MSKSAIKELLFAKIEVTYGTDPVPTVDDAVLIQNISHGPIVADAKTRNYAMPVWGADVQELAQMRRTLSFDWDWSGSGEAGTAPVWGVFMRACAHTETVTADTKVEYTPLTQDDSNAESATFYYYLDGLLHKLVGAKGTITANLQGGDLPTFHAEVTGFYSPVTDGAFPDGWSDALSAFLKSVESNEVNTTFSVHGYDAVLQQFGLTQGNTVAFARRANRKATDITNRVSSGSLTIRTPSIADFNWSQKVETKALGAIALTHGTVAGNIVQIDEPNVQLLPPTYSKDGDRSLLQFNLNLVRSGAGDDEYKITVK